MAVLFRLSLDEFNTWGFFIRQMPKSFCSFSFEKMNKVKNSETVEPFSVDQTVISLLQMILLNRKK